MALRPSRTRLSRESSIDRTQFLRGNWRGVADIITPPWALEGERFFGSALPGIPWGVRVSGESWPRNEGDHPNSQGRNVGLREAAQ